ncbi:MAG: DUF4199 domain-containing protein [Weeksellaceae bacterium]|nr:DUF4199 domain-containing protein [Weeksellaceae bacterium]
MKKYFTKYEWRWAAIYTMVILIWCAVEFELGWHSENIEKHKYLTLLFIIPAAIVYYIFLIDKKSHRYKKRMKWKHGFFSGMALTLLTILILTPLQFLIFRFITPDFFDNYIAAAIEQNQFTAEEAERIFNSWSFAVYIPIAFGLLGLFLSAIIALFTMGRRRY